MGIQSDISRLKFNKTTTTYKFDKGNQTICLRIRERVVRTGVVERTNDNEKRELTFKEEGQEYAQVLKMLGNGRLEALCSDGSKRLAHIRGKLRKKVWINQGDIILL